MGGNQDQTSPVLQKLVDDIQTNLQNQQRAEDDLIQAVFTDISSRVREMDAEGKSGIPTIRGRLK